MKIIQIRSICLDLADIGREIQTRTQTLQQAVDNLSKQQQPMIEIVRELPRKLDDLRQSQSQTEILKTISAKLDPLAQSIKTIKEGVNTVGFFNNKSRFCASL